jgi:hypothetical protein
MLLELLLYSVDTGLFLTRANIQLAYLGAKGVYTMYKGVNSVVKYMNPPAPQVRLLQIEQDEDYSVVTRL